MTIIDAARSVRAAAAAAVDDMESNCRLSPDLAATFATAGLMRMLSPVGLGAAQAHPADFVDAVAEVSAANGSAGWCVMISATTSLMAGWMDEPGATEVYGNPDGVWAGAYAPSGVGRIEGDAIVVDGRWAWGSGCENADWFSGGTLCDDGSFRLCCVPAEEVTIHRDWDVVGMRGTGSHDWSVSGAVVPRSRSIELVGLVPVAPGPLYRMPLFGVLAAGVAATGIGIGRAALDEIISLATEKTPTTHSRRLAERDSVQSEIARRAVQLAAANSHLRAELTAAFDAAAAGVTATSADRARLRSASTHAAHAGLEVTTACFTLAGGTSVRNSSPLARLVRDAHVVTQHMMTSAATYEPAGRALLGAELGPFDL